MSIRTITEEDVHWTVLGKGSLRRMKLLYMSAAKVLLTWERYEVLSYIITQAV
jgi:predicted DNA-binding protein with PD1-like motif